MAKKKAKDPDQMNYVESVEEVETILESIDSDEVDIDALSDKVERAVALLRICQQKLRSTESRVQEVLAEMEAESPVSRPEESGAEETASASEAPPNRPEKGNSPPPDEEG